MVETAVAPSMLDMGISMVVGGVDALLRQLLPPSLASE